VTDTTKSFGERLRALMEARQETQASVAVGINVSPQAVGKWVSGGLIDDSNLKTLARYLDTSWLWLRYGDEAIAEARSWAAKNDPLEEEKQRLISEVFTNERRVDLIMERCKYGVWEVDLITGFSFFNRVCLDILRQKEVPSREALRALVHPDSLQRFDSFLSSVVRSEVADTTSFQLKDDPETVVKALGLATPGADGGLRILGLMIRASDVMRWR
jgi:transcriptional regulator with XRE-family HTH domain